MATTNGRRVDRGRRAHETGLASNPYTLASALEAIVDRSGGLLKKQTVGPGHVARAASNGTTNLSVNALQQHLVEIDLYLADIQQMVEVGIRATEDLRRCNDPTYYRLPAGGLGDADV
jgi:hypothetical protein